MLHMLSNYTMQLTICDRCLLCSTPDKLHTLNRETKLGIVWRIHLCTKAARNDHTISQMILNTSASCIITQYSGAYFLSNSYVKRQKSICLATPTSNNSSCFVYCYYGRKAVAAMLSMILAKSCLTLTAYSGRGSFIPLLRRISLPLLLYATSLHHHSFYTAHIHNMHNVM